MALRANHTTASPLAKRDPKLLGRDHPAMPLEVVAVEGSTVRDARGRTYVDFVMGWCVGNLGWNRPEIAERLARFHGPDYAMPAALYAPWLELAERLLALVPGPLARVYRATTGTEAVELALRIAKEYTRRDRFVSIADDYHGNSLAVKETIERLIEPPLDGRALAQLETVLADRTVAALVMEPVIMNLGIELPSLRFMQGAAALCEKYGTLFVADEVACGFGRTGRLFAYEHFDLRPDIVCLAKGLTNGAAPLAATLATARVADAVRGDVDFYVTFGWLPRACEVAIAVVEIWQREGPQILANVAARETQAIRRLHDMALPDGYTARVKGVCIGIDLPEGSDAEGIADACREQGLLIAGEEGQLSIYAACTVDEATFDRGFDILADVLQP